VNVLPPRFIEGVHWRRLTSDERAGSPWKYVLLRDVTFDYSPPAVATTWLLKDRDGILRGLIEPRDITVCRGYAWNGCSFSPDLELLASLPHDLLYQFSGVPGFPATITRRWADRLFGALTTTGLGWAYRLGLLVGSWVCWGAPPDGLSVQKMEIKIR